MTLFLKGRASTLKRQIPIKPRKKWEQPGDEWGRGRAGGREGGGKRLWLSLPGPLTPLALAERGLLGGASLCSVLA